MKIYGRDGERPAPDRLPFGRRTRPAAHALIAILVALVLGSFLNAAAMKKTALEMPFGAARSFKLAIVEPLASLSHLVRLDEPAKLTASVLGRPAPGPAPVAVIDAPPPKPAKQHGKGGKKPKPGSTALPRPTAASPLKLLIAGDSMSGMPGTALVNLARATGVIRSRLDYRISTGLARPDAFDWPAELQAQVKSLHPRAAVVMWGANDNQGLQAPSGKVYLFGSKGWADEYRRRVRNVLAILLDGGVRRVYWIGQPLMADAHLSRQLQVINTIVRGEVTRYDGVEYIDPTSLLATSSGQYAQYLRDPSGNLVQVREGDGEHMTYAGGIWLARVILTTIRHDWLPKKQPGGAASQGATTPTPKASKTP